MPFFDWASQSMCNISRPTRTATYVPGNVTPTTSETSLKAPPTTGGMTRRGKTRPRTMFPELTTTATATSNRLTGAGKMR